MSVNQPLNANNHSIQLTPATAALGRTVSSSISSATSIGLNPSTTIIEVQAVNTGVYLRYQAGVTNANFDEHIQADTVRHYVIPPDVTLISVIEDAASATVYVIEK